MIGHGPESEPIEDLLYEKRDRLELGREREGVKGRNRSFLKESGATFRAISPQPPQKKPSCTMNSLGKRGLCSPRRSLAGLRMVQLEASVPRQPPRHQIDRSPPKPMEAETLPRFFCVLSQGALELIQLEARDGTRKNRRGPTWTCIL